MLITGGHLEVSTGGHGNVQLKAVGDLRVYGLAADQDLPCRVPWTQADQQPLAGSHPSQPAPAAVLEQHVQELRRA